MELFNLLQARGIGGPKNVRPYVMDGIDSGFLHTVKNMISSNYYSELFTIDNHLVNLETIRKKLSMMIAAETRSGMMNWSLRERVNEVNVLSDKLQKLKQGLFGTL